MGSQFSCLIRGLACSALQDLKLSLAAEFCTYWSGLMTALSVDILLLRNCSFVIWTGCMS